MSLLKQTKFEIIKTLRKHPLCHDQVGKSLCEFLSWQIGSRLLPGSFIFKFTDSARLIVRRGMRGATGNLYLGLHEFEEMAFVTHLLRPNDWFVDVGANIGSYTVLASAVAGSHTIAIEPVPSTFSDLMDNIRINNIDSLVIPINQGVAEKNSTLEFTQGLDSINHVVLKETREEIKNKVEVKVATLDDIVSNQFPICIKVDVEGFEMQVLRGGDRTFENPILKAVVMEVNTSGERYGYQDQDIHKRMIDFGFKTYRYLPFTRTLEPLNDSLSDHDNTLYLRDLEFVQKRLRDAEMINVKNKQV